MKYTGYQHLYDVTLVLHSAFNKFCNATWMSQRSIHKKQPSKKELFIHLQDTTSVHGKVYALHDILHIPGQRHIQVLQRLMEKALCIVVSERIQCTQAMVAHK